MRKLAMLAMWLLLVTGRSGLAQDSTTAVDSQAVRWMPMMWMHLDSVATWSPEQIKKMMPQHQQMVTRMMQSGPGHMMGPGMMGGPGKMGTSPYVTALRDSVERDLTVLPSLSGKELQSRMQGHVDRLRRLMVLRMGMMGGGGGAGMPGGCVMVDSIGHMSSAQLQRMWPMHARMSGQMMDAMMANMQAVGTPPDSAWLALRDSVRADMTELPRLQGDSLRTLMLAHRGRMQRLMGLHVQRMGMHMGPMGMGCPM